MFIPNDRAQFFKDCYEAAVRRAEKAEAALAACEAARREVADDAATLNGYIARYGETPTATAVRAASAEADAARANEALKKIRAREAAVRELDSLLNELLEYFEEREDINDAGSANEEMQFAMRLRDVKEKKNAP